MNVLFDDLLQNSNAPATLISGSLADVWVGNSVTVTLSETSVWNSVGIARTDATVVTVNGVGIDVDPTPPRKIKKSKGLYMIDEQDTDTVVISHNGSYIGRLAVGVGHSIPIAKAAEPEMWTTNQQQKTAGESAIPGAGGVSGRSQSVDIRYQITREVFESFDLAYDDQIARGLPLFVYFGAEVDCLPWRRFYGTVPTKTVFQSSVNYFLYSKRWKFRESF